MTSLITLKTLDNRYLMVYMNIKTLIKYILNLASPSVQTIYYCTTTISVFTYTLFHVNNIHILFCSSQENALKVFHSKCTYTNNDVISISVCRV